jgi:hypothetical protein
VKPVDRCDQTARQHLDVESEMTRMHVDLLLGAGEQVDEQRPEPAPLELLGNEAVP